MWGIFSKILNVILGLLAIYFYIENRKLKGYEIDKDIQLKKAEWERVNQWYARKMNEISKEESKELRKGGAGYLYSMGAIYRDRDSVQKKYESKIESLKAELEYLEKIKKYKWIFSK